MDDQYDVIVIGGGITGAGVFRDLALRGFKSLLIEKGSPGKGTTVSSTHLIHGGLRYLLYDRFTTHSTCWDSGNIVQIARPLLKRLPIVWPLYKDHLHGLGTVETLLESYDPFQKMKEGLPHLRLSREDTLTLFPGIKKEGLKGAVSFDEWWVDPIELVEKNIKSAERVGSSFMSQTEFLGVGVKNKKVNSVRVRLSSGEEKVFHGRHVVNAAGPWGDKVAKQAGIPFSIHRQKGTHLVYEKDLALSTAPFPVGLLLEAVDRHRYVFVVPGGGMTLVGPTDIHTQEDQDNLKTEPEEIDYLLQSVRRYFLDFPDNYSRTVVGSRPILEQSGNEKLLSREFEVFNHKERDGLAGFITVSGGKMSDFRLMGEAVGDLICHTDKKQVDCQTHRKTLLDDSEVSPSLYSLPSSFLQKFFRRHPLLRQFHALAYLGWASLRHIIRALISSPVKNSYEEFLSRYGKSG